MKTLAEYLTEYLDRKDGINNILPDDISTIREWITEGIKAYEAAENVNLVMELRDGDPKEPKSYDVQNVIDAQCTLEPMKCRHCGKVGETTYYDRQGDAYCATCGRWQLQD